MKAELNHKIYLFFTSPKICMGLLIVILFASTIQQLSLPIEMKADGPQSLYNNFLIFKYSFFHLIEGKDLYIYHPDHYIDLYKYSPTFALLMFPFAYLPNWLGLFLWNLLNVGIFALGIKRLNFLNNTKKVLLIWFLAHELLLSTQNAQSNTLIAGLILLAYSYLEKNKVIEASFLLVIGFFIKPFVLVAFSLAIFSKLKLKFTLYCLLWFLILITLPILFIGIDQLIVQYKSWGNLLKNDNSVCYGVSAMGIAKNIFNLDAKNEIFILGIILFLSPLINYKNYSESLFRQLFLASVLLWVICFNPKSESPTFIIAVCGVGIWYYSFSRKLIDLILLLFCLYLTQLTASEVFFYTKWRSEYIIPYDLKALPCVIIWLRLSYELLTRKFHTQNSLI